MDGDGDALSGGWKMGVAPGRIPLMGPDFILMDEPGNHLDLERLIWLEQFLAALSNRLPELSPERVLQDGGD